MGRDEEQALCRQLTDEVRRGQSACLALTGEPGIGKTRLAQAILNLLSEDGWKVGTARADEATATIPFWLAHQSLRDLVDITHHVESLAGAVERGSDEAGLSRFRLIEHLVAALSTTITEHGLALLWDDVKWADPSSLEALPHLIDVLSSRPLLVILTVGVERLDSDHPLERTLYRLDRERSLARLPLSRLSSDQTVAMGRALLGGEIPETLGELLVEQTCGNPFFIEETIKALLEQGSLLATDDGWTYAPQAPPLIPTGLRAAVTQRLSHLPDDTQEVLRSASVLGRRFSLDSLALMIDSPARAVEAVLHPSVSAGVIEATPDGFEFAHDRIRDVLYEALALIDRRTLHLAAAEALERLSGGDPVMAPLHWRLGGNLDAAIDGELAASEVALEAGGLREALVHRQTAVAMAKAREVDPGRRTKALEALADVQRHLAPIRAAAAYEDALSGAGLTDEDRERLWRKLQIAQSLAGNLRVAGALPPPSDPAHRPQALAAKAFNLALQGDVAGAKALSRETADTHDPNITCLRHATNAMVAYLTGDRDACLRDGRAAYDLSSYERPRRKEMLRYTTLWQLLRYYMTYKADVGSPIDALGKAEVEGNLPLEADMLGLATRSIRGSVCFFRGRWAEAAENFDRAQTHALDADSMLALPILSFFAPSFWIAAGDVDRAGPVLESALEPLEQCGLAPAFGLIPALVELSHVHRLQRDLQAARRRLEQAAALEGEATICVDGLVDVARAELALDQRDRKAAAAQLDRALERARGLGDLLTQLECHRLLGVLGTDRRTNFSAAVELAEQVGSPWLELRALKSWAGAGELPSQRLLYRRSALERQLRDSSSSKERRHPLLTSREVEVLACLADGLSTREIADHLCISEKTVERHVANIYTKIDVHNRVAALRYYEAHIRQPGLRSHGATA